MSNHNVTGRLNLNLYSGHEYRIWPSICAPTDRAGRCALATYRRSIRAAPPTFVRRCWSVTPSQVLYLQHPLLLQKTERGQPTANSTLPPQAARFGRCWRRSSFSAMLKTKDIGLIEMGRGRHALDRHGASRRRVARRDDETAALAPRRNGPLLRANRRCDWSPRTPWA